MKLKEIKTPSLRLAYEEGGPSSGEPLILLHGWPDSARTWDEVAPVLHKAGYRTIAPYLRGYAPTRYRDPLFGKRARTGQPVALAQDVLDLADRLGLRRFHFIGHDWGARTGYVLAALQPHRLKSLTALSVVFQPGKPQPPALKQAQAYWYQWLLCTQPGEKSFRDDPVAFGRAQWDAWSPQGWYTEAEFATAARSWGSKDFQDTTLHSYRSRWGHAPMDPKYADLQARFESAETIGVPTQLIHGEEDRCLLLETTESAARHFTAEYRRIVISGVGHFVQREKPLETADAILDHIRRFE